jgi:hypothetical protein
MRIVGRITMLAEYKTGLNSTIKVEDESGLGTAIIETNKEAFLDFIKEKNLTIGTTLIVTVERRDT